MRPLREACCSLHAGRWQLARFKGGERVGTGQGRAERALWREWRGYYRGMPYYWLSFADDERFRGAAIVEAPHLWAALPEANRRGLNPGGECLAMEIPPEHVEEARVYRNRLITDGRELARFGEPSTHEQYETLVQESPDVAFRVCARCNSITCPGC